MNWGNGLLLFGVAVGSPGIVFAKLPTNVVIAIGQWWRVVSLVFTLICKDRLDQGSHDHWSIIRATEA